MNFISAPSERGDGLRFDARSLLQDLSNAPRNACPVGGAPEELWMLYFVHFHFANWRLYMRLLYEPAV